MIDRDGRADMLDLLASLPDTGIAVVHITHDPAEAARADRVITVDGGRVLSDVPDSSSIDRPWPGCAPRYPEEESRGATRDVSKTREATTASSAKEGGRARVGNPDPHEYGAPVGGPSRTHL